MYFLLYSSSVIIALSTSSFMKLFFIVLYISLSLNGDKLKSNKHLDASNESLKLPSGLKIIFSKKKYHSGIEGFFIYS